MKISLAKKTLLFCITFCFIALTSIGQTPKDTLAAFIHFKKADSLLTSRNYKESIALFKRALPIYNKAKAWERVASCYNKISKNLLGIPRLEESLQQSKKGLKTCNTYLIENHPEEANVYDNIGEYYRLKGVYESVLEYHEKALEIRKKTFPEFHLSIATSYMNIGLFYDYISKNQKAIMYYEKALNIYQNILEPKDQKIANIYNNIGSVYHGVEKYDEAISYYQKSLDITIKNLGENNINTAYSNGNISIAFIKMKQLDQALSYAEKALQVLKKIQHDNGLSIIYLNIGSIYIEKGEKNKAFQYYKKSLNLKRKIYGENHYKQALNYFNMGIVYEDSEIEKSLFYYTKALDIFKLTYTENHSTVADVYQSLGGIYVLKKEYDVALNYYRKSLKIREQILGKNHTDLANSYYKIGDLHNKKTMYGSALMYYKKCLDGINKSGKFSDLVPNCYTAIGTMYCKQNDYENALTYLDKALTYNTKENTKSTDNIFNPDNYHFLDMLFQTLLIKAKTLQKHYEKHQKTENLNESLKLYQNLDILADRFRQSYQNHEDKVRLAEQAKEIYTDAIAANLLNHEITNNPKDLEKAFYFAEKSKSNILKDLLLDTNAKGFSELPEEITTLETSLKSNRAFYQSQIVAQQTKDSIDTAYIKEYEDKLFNVSRRQDSLANVLEKEYPKYYQLKHNKTPISIKEIQSKINEQTTLLEFFTTDSITYAFTVTKHTVSVKELPLTGLSEKVEALNTAITTENNEAYKKTAHSLYKELLLPIKNNLVGDELIIIPDGPLWHLNFDLLLTQESNQQNTRDLPYLLRDYAISYGNSAHLLFNPTENSSKTSNKREECLAFSFSDTTDILQTKTMRLATLRDAGDDLPGTRKEIRAIADIIDGQYYYGSEANEKAFKQNAGQYSMLHLALHGEVDNEKPQNSKLFFTKSKDTIEDNLLYGHELFALNIPADLVVLSACNTGTGKVANGEGLMSLGNAFQYAGAKSLLLSKWEVSDKTTPDLMKYFYTNLKEGMNKAKALQQAKLKYLNTTETFYTHPFYWGSFYILGNTDAIPMYTGVNTMYLWGIGLLLALLGLVVLIRRRVANK